MPKRLFTSLYPLQYSVIRPWLSLNLKLSLSFFATVPVDETYTLPAPFESLGMSAMHSALPVGTEVNLHGLGWRKKNSFFNGNHSALILGAQLRCWYHVLSPLTHSPRLPSAQEAPGFPGWWSELWLLPMTCNPLHWGEGLGEDPSQALPVWTVFEVWRCWTQSWMNIDVVFLYLCVYLANRSHLVTGSNPNLSASGRGLKMLRSTASSCQVKDGALDKVGRLENQNKCFQDKRKFCLLRPTSLPERVSRRPCKLFCQCNHCMSLCFRS